MCESRRRVRSIILPRAALVLAASFLLAAPATLLGVNGEILDQQVNGTKGYTVLRVWGGHYDMGYAQAWLMHSEIAAAADEIRNLIGEYYELARAIVETGTVWKPDGIEDELDGMVAALAVLEPAANIDKIDLKIANLISDLGYMPVLCRSHSCWGHFVADPIKTLSTRRLDYSTPVPTANHHVLCVWLPTDGSPAWANLAWPGFVSVVTGVNEFGTQASLHDYNSSSSDWPIDPWLARSVAARYALTMVTDPNLAGHADDVYAELQNYNAGTGSFINYYVPEGHGAVITCRRTPAPTFYKLRKPHPSYFSGDVLITTNSETDGSYTPSGGDFMADYYQDLEDANETATLLGHWNVMGSSFHRMSIAYRGRADMTIWFDGRLDPGVTPRVELEWADLVDDVLKTLTLDIINGQWGSVEAAPNQPVFEPNQIVTLTATPIEGKAFRHWEIYDPNRPGDANYAVIDANNPITIVMNADREVTAVFKCGSGMAGPLLLITVTIYGLGSLLRRRWGPLA